MTRMRLQNAAIAWLARGVLTLLFWGTAHAGTPVLVPQAAPGTIAFALHREPLWLAVQLLPILFALLMLVTGLAGRLRTACARAAHDNWFWTVTLFSCAYVALAALVALPLDFYRDVADLHAWGQSPPPTAAWTIGEATGLAGRLVLTGLFVWIPYALIARSPAAGGSMRRSR